MTQSDANQNFPRHLRNAMKIALSDTPVVCLLGPRQSGKSTLAQSYDLNRTYVDLDDQDLLRLAKNDPQGFIDELPEQVTIDEIQRVPELTLAIKRSVDANRKPGRFLLTGSANLLQLPRLADSLAGRMECLHLHPLTEVEKEQGNRNFLTDWMDGKLESNFKTTAKPAPSRLPERLVTGGFPEAVKRPEKRARTWQKQYLQSIIERDIHDISDVQDASDVTRLLEYLTHQTAQLLNISTIANALRHTRRTVNVHLGILEKLFLVRRLPAWHSNRSKRLVKTPKVHICDSGLAAALSGLQTNKWNEERPRFGHLLESFVFQQLQAMADWSDEDFRFCHYRDKDKVEVDLVIETGNEIRGIEVKAAATAHDQDGKGLRRLADIAGKQFKGGMVLYDGQHTLPIDKSLNLWHAPVSSLWGE